MDKISGLGLGADDYVTKPFELDVLLARVARALKRVELMRSDAAAATPPPAAAAEKASFAFAGFTVDPARMRLGDGARTAAELTAREIRIMRLFARHPGEVLKREHLLETLWGVGHLASTRTLDQHIMALRRKLGDAASVIEMVYGVGYRYSEPEPRARKRKSSSCATP